MKRIRKALVAGAGAGIFAGLAGLGVALSDGGLNAGEALIALGAGVTALAATGSAVYKVENVKTSHQDAGLLGP